jgi:threonine dehydrogenase-like Zn-dependent dehydrogenase
MIFRFGSLALAALVELLTTPVPSHASAAPVPEPATIVLVGVGAGALGVAAWLKRRRRK